MFQSWKRNPGSRSKLGQNSGSGSKFNIFGSRTLCVCQAAARTGLLWPAGCGHHPPVRAGHHEDQQEGSHHHHSSSFSILCPVFWHFTVVRGSGSFVITLFLIILFYMHFFIKNFFIQVFYHRFFIQYGLFYYNFCYTAFLNTGLFFIMDFFL